MPPTRPPLVTVSSRPPRSRAQRRDGHNGGGCLGLGPVQSTCPRSPFLPRHPQWTSAGPGAHDGPRASRPSPALGEAGGAVFSKFAWGGGGDPPGVTPPGRNAELMHVGTRSGTKRSKKFGSSVAYKTIRGGGGHTRGSCQVKFAAVNFAVVRFAEALGFRVVNFADTPINVVVRRALRAG